MLVRMSRTVIPVGLRICIAHLGYPGKLRYRQVTGVEVATSFITVGANSGLNWRLVNGFAILKSMRPVGSYRKTGCIGDVSIDEVDEVLPGNNMGVSE